MELAPRARFPLLVIAQFPEAEVLNPGDPTDNALAAIASMLDQPEPHREPETAAYSKSGPGPMAAIRFKWSVRRGDNGEYYVDETIGENSAPLVSGPLTMDAAVALVDERENEARRRFALLKSEMTGRTAAANMVRKDGGEP